MSFKKEDYVKIVGVNGDYRYGYIEKTMEKGCRFLINLYEEGESAVAYTMESGELAPDWDKMLSDVEKEIIKGLGCQLTTKDIGTALSLSPITVRAHIRTLRLKLRLDNREQLVAFAQGMYSHLEKEE